MTRGTHSHHITCGYPLKLEPQFVERVWGSENLEPIYRTGPGAPRRIGEVWLTGDNNRVANGPYAGQSLRDLTRSCGPALLGEGKGVDHPSGSPVFPLLVKFLFTTDKLSVQVHPPDTVAVEQNSWGKTEMWHILHAEPAARLAVGFRAGVPEDFFSRPERLREAAETGAIEQMLDWREVRATETYFIPAGTVHAIGSGITLCEIQQNSDITYRLYDYKRPGTDGKPRQLHVEQALNVIGREAGGGGTIPFDLSGETGHRRLLAACPYFATERWEFPSATDEKPFWAHGNGEMEQLEIWVALEGATELEAGGQRVTLRQGEAAILPADARSCRVNAGAGAVLLRAYPPDWERDIARPLRAAGASSEQFGGVCFPQIVAKEATR